MKFKNIIFDIKNSFYNKTVIQQDGITHKVEDLTEYPIIEMSIHIIKKTGDKSEFISEVQQELQEFCQYLEQFKDRDKERS